ncbi:MAG: Maf family protein [Pseudomonadota bacterium]
MDNLTVALASASPRRKALLQQLGLSVVRVGTEIDESRQSGEAIVQYVARLAREKAAAGRQDARSQGLPVIGGDTVVAVGETRFDKPSGYEDAMETLKFLGGRTHDVHSAVAIAFADQVPTVSVVSSRVTFRALKDAEIDAYWASGEPRGKAGAYAIQGLGAAFVEHLEGSHSAVMGLPVFEVAKMLRDGGLDVLDGSRWAA